MPIRFKIVKSPRLHLVSYHGVVTNEDMLVSYMAAYKDPLYVPGIPEISDTRQIVVNDIDFHGIQKLINWVDSREDLKGTNTRVGILLADDVLSGISKLYAAATDMYEKETVGIFRELGPLLDWLPIDRSALSAIQGELAEMAQSDDSSAGTKVGIG